MCTYRSFIYMCKWTQTKETLGVRRYWTMQVQGKGTGHSDSTDSFQAVVVNSLVALNSLPNRVAEIQTATTQILEENAEMKKSIEYSNEQIAALTTTVKDQATDIQKLTTELAHESKQGGILAKRVQVQNQQILQQEVYSRKSNIIIEGLEGSENESLWMSKWQICHQNEHGWHRQNSQVRKVNWFGRSIGGKPRPIIVKYVTHRARDEVLYAVRNLKNKPRCDPGSIYPIIQLSRLSEEETGGSRPGRPHPTTDVWNELHQDEEDWWWIGDGDGAYLIRYA